MIERVVRDLAPEINSRLRRSRTLVLAYLAIGDKGRAIDVLERGYVERDNYEINIASDPLMDPLRDDPRFQAVCRQVMLGSELSAPAFAMPPKPIAR